MGRSLQPNDDEINDEETPTRQNDGKLISALPVKYCVPLAEVYVICVIIKQSIYETCIQNLKNSCM